MPHHPATRRTTSLTTVALVATAALIGLTACGGGGAQSSSGGAAQGGSAAPAQQKETGANKAPGSGSRSATGSGSGFVGGTVGAAAPGGVAALALRRQIRTGDMTVQVPDVVVAAGKVRSIATLAKGVVADERTATGVPGELPTSTISLRVPEPGLDAVMDDVAGVGTVITRRQSSEDVTDQYVDTQSRVASQRDSVARIRKLLADARDISQIVQIEAELSRRQADLDALEAQLANLQDQTALATLTVSLTTQPPAPKKHVTHEQTGFLVGLNGGWKAFTGTFAVVLTVLGALLPFLLLAVLLGVPARLAWKRWLAQRPVSGAPAGAPPYATPPAATP